MLEALGEGQSFCLQLSAQLTTAGELGGEGGNLEGGREGGGISEERRVGKRKAWRSKISMISVRSRVWETFCILI